MECPQCGKEMGRYDTTYKYGGWSGWECPTSLEHSIYDDEIDVEEVQAHQAMMRDMFKDMKRPVVEQSLERYDS